MDLLADLADLVDLVDLVGHVVEGGELRHIAPEHFERFWMVEDQEVGTGGGSGKSSALVDMAIELLENK